MKILKTLFYGISVCIIIVCIAILGITSKPEWSDKLSELLYENNSDDTEEESEETRETETDSTQTESNTEPKNTPLVYVTPKPEKETLQGEENLENGPVQNTYEPMTIDIKTVCPPRAPICAYRVPQSDAVTIPESMNGLSGYTEIAATMTEVKADEAAKLKTELGEGDTGALLVFEQNFYPYYHMLNDEEKELYRQIYANAYALNEKFSPCVEIFSTNLGRVVEAVFNDHPVLFWIETSYGCKYGPDGRVVEISLQYNEASKKIEQSRQKFEEKAEEILRVARTLNSDYEKEKYVHDRLAALVTYGADADMNQSAYSALVGGKTVCAGYARAFQYLMQQLGIPCYYCRGYSGENHAWNIVELFGDYYNVDVTWDDAELNNYDYFNKTDEDLAATHIRKSLSVKLPACNGILYGGLEETHEEQEQTDGTQQDSTAGLDMYYTRVCERIEAMGCGDAEYYDMLDAAVWKEMEEAYQNGNNAFREEYLIRSLQMVGADYCIINLSAEKVTENAYEVTCSMKVR